MASAEMAGIENLLRSLLERIPTGDQFNEARQDTQSEEILLDVDVDGARYLFIRLPKASQLPVQLTPREREIARLVALGHSSKIIADVLSISSWTVCTHLRRIFSKLGVSSRAAMVAHVSETKRTAAADHDVRKSELRETAKPASRSGGQGALMGGLKASLTLASPPALARK